MNQKNKGIYAMVMTGALMAIGFVLPFVAGGNVRQFMIAICPLHIPVLICGLTCGWKWGLLLGLILPPLRGVLFTLPRIPDVAFPMSFELAAYGALTGLLYPLFYRLFNKRNHLPAILAALVIAMLLGRFVGGAAKALMLSLGFFDGDAFTFKAFFASYFVSTSPGMLVHVILVPAVVLALERARLSPMFARG